jgi:hypothetical protein
MRTYQKELDSAKANSHQISTCHCGGPRVHAKRIPGTSRCLACRVFTGPEVSSFTDKPYVLTDLDREVIEYWQRKSEPTLAAGDIDQRIVDLVSRAKAQGHEVKKCKKCGGPEVHSLTRANTSKCFRCGRFRGVAAPASNEVQPFKGPYTMSYAQRLARYRKRPWEAETTQRLCVGCRASLEERRKSVRYCSHRCRMQTRRDPLRTRRSRRGRHLSVRVTGEALQ